MGSCELDMCKLDSHLKNSSSNLSTGLIWFYYICANLTHTSTSSLKPSSRLANYENAIRRDILLSSQAVRSIFEPPKLAAYMYINQFQYDIKMLYLTNCEKFYQAHKQICKISSIVETPEKIYLNSFCCLYITVVIWKFLY